MGTRRVAASNDEVSADVALVAEEVLLEEGHGGDDTRLAAGRKRVEFELGGDEGGGELGISCCTGTSTPDLRGNVVKLLAVLVGNDWS